MVLLTIGYESLNIETFFDILNSNHVQTLVDIRELPISRKRGFSKTALSQQCSAFGINYVHIGELGTPQKIKHDYRIDDDWIRFSERYEAHLKTQSEALGRLAKIAANQICCMMCFEADYHKCHRWYVAKALSAKSLGTLQVIHLGGLVTMPVVWPQPLVDISLLQ